MGKNIFKSILLFFGTVFLILFGLPLFVLGIPFIAIYLLWVECTREYRCQWCNAWMSKKKLKNGERFCNKDCYYQR